ELPVLVLLRLVGVRHELRQEFALAAEVSMIEFFGVVARQSVRVDKVAFGCGRSLAELVGVVGRRGQARGVFLDAARSVCLELTAQGARTGGRDFGERSCGRLVVRGHIEDLRIEYCVERAIDNCWYHTNSRKRAWAGQTRHWNINSK